MADLETIALLHWHLDSKFFKLKILTRKNLALVTAL